MGNSEHDETFVTEAELKGISFNNLSSVSDRDFSEAFHEAISFVNSIYNHSNHNQSHCKYQSDPKRPFFHWQA